MKFSEEKMTELVELLARHTPQNGVNETGIAALVTYRATELQPRKSVVYEPALIILGQGKKHCYLGGEKYDYSAGNYLTLFLPMPVEASVEKPLLMAGIKVDLPRMANILLKVDSVKPLPTKAGADDSSGIQVQVLNDELLEPILKLLHMLGDPVERAVLSDVILEEIYYRIICNDTSGSLLHLLQHRGEVQQISKVVEHINRHIDVIVSVDEMADMVNMSTSGFRKVFRDVMHMPPLQYAKSMKLNRAQLLLLEGKNASEAGYLVGYNSPAQFSREYKRYFGYSPSQVSGRS